MAYETLISSSMIKPTNKPDYTSMKTVRKALKTVLGKFFKKTSLKKHQKLQNESFHLPKESPSASSSPAFSLCVEHSFSYSTDEEYDNYENELLEAAAAQQQQQLRA